MKKIVLVLLLFFTAIMTASASELPKSVTAKLKRDIPNVSIRFDGLIQFPDGTQYLPIFPMTLEEKGSVANVALTFPAKKSIKDEPPLILFDNNFSMLKILKSQTHNPTVIFYSEMPLCVKRGLLPQDLLVPENLVFPEELQILLGDLAIPTESLDDEFDYLKELDRAIEPKKALQSKQRNPLPSPQFFDKKMPYLARKLICAINNQTNCVYLINPETGKIVTYIPLRSTPSSILMTKDKRYLLLTMMGSSKIAVIDLTTQVVVKEFDSGTMPNSLEVNKDRNIAYVANQESSNISVLDLGNMEIKSRIEVSGHPCKLSLSPDKKYLFYLDADTETVNVVILNDDFNEIKPLFKTKNLSKLLFSGDKLYISSRDRNYVTVINAISLKPVNNIPVGEKPLDMMIYNSKLFVLNAGSDTISVIDLKTQKKIADIALCTKGFPNRINALEVPSKAIITTATAHEYVLVDLNKNSVEKKFPIEPLVSNIIISGKN